MGFTLVVIVLVLSVIGLTLSKTSLGKPYSASDSKNCVSYRNNYSAT